MMFTGGRAVKTIYLTACLSADRDQQDIQDMSASPPSVGFAYMHSFKKPKKGFSNVDRGYARRGRGQGMLRGTSGEAKNDSEYG
jgi:hypothetical protein